MTTDTDNAKDSTEELTPEYVSRNAGIKGVLLWFSDPFSRTSQPAWARFKQLYHTGAQKIHFVWDREFGNYRRFYRLIMALFANFHFILKFLLKRHDTLATDENIPPEDYNDLLFIFRGSYEKAFEIWSKYYMNNRRFNKDGTPMSKDSFYDMMYNELNQKAIRFLLDMWSTVYLEDTIYRELTNIWMYEMQWQMNARFNPETQNNHVWYTNVIRNDAAYYKMKEDIRIEVANKQLPKKATKQRQQVVNDNYQKLYMQRRIQNDIDMYKKKLDSLTKMQEKVNEQP